MLRWLRITLNVRKSSGEVLEVEPPYTTKEGDEVILRHGPTSRAFAIGERIALTSQTFADICWTVTLFGQHLGQAVEGCGNRIGVSIDPRD